MDKNATQPGRRKRVIWIVVLAMAAILTGCGSNPTVPSGTTTGTKTAATTTLPPETTSETTAATTNAPPVARALDGPRAESDGWILRTGETRRLSEPGEDTDLLIAWVEVENVGEHSLTVSSLLSVELTDKATGDTASVPDLVEMLRRITAVDPGCATLDGDIPPGGRLSGWVYGEFPAGTGEITVTVTPDATQDATSVESLQVDLIYQ